jgi:hypothetical protein
MDKASVLGDAIKYLKQLQEKVKTLEEQTKRKTMESVVIVKKSHIYVDEGDVNSSSDESKGPIHEALPEIEARFCDKHVLIRIHCEKRKGVLEKTVAEIEKLHLSVINSSVLAFGTSALHVTFIAQVSSVLNQFFQTSSLTCACMCLLPLISNTNKGLVYPLLADGYRLQHVIEGSSEDFTLSFRVLHVKKKLLQAQLV